MPTPLSAEILGTQAPVSVVVFGRQGLGQGDVRWWRLGRCLWWFSCVFAHGYIPLVEGTVYKHKLTSGTVFVNIKIKKQPFGWLFDCKKSILLGRLTPEMLYSIFSPIFFGVIAKMKKIIANAKKINSFSEPQYSDQPPIMLTRVHLKIPIFIKNC